MLWGRNTAEMTKMAQQRQNQRFLPGITFPEALQIETDLATAVANKPRYIDCRRVTFLPMC